MVIDLVSPQGTTSRLLAKRPLDSSSDGLAKWPFTSVEFWDEKPLGEWTVTIRDEKVMYFASNLKRGKYSLKIKSRKS